MTDDSTSQIALRLPNELLARIDQYALQLEAQTPGLNPSRALCIRVLITRALDEAQVATPAKAKKRSR